MVRLLLLLPFGLEFKSIPFFVERRLGRAQGRRLRFCGTPPQRRQPGGIRPLHLQLRSSIQCCCQLVLQWLAEPSETTAVVFNLSVQTPTLLDMRAASFRAPPSSCMAYHQCNLSPLHMREDTFRALSRWNRPHWAHRQECMPASGRGPRCRQG